MQLRQVVTACPGVHAADSDSIVMRFGPNYAAMAQTAPCPLGFGLSALQALGLRRAQDVCDAARGRPRSGFVNAGPLAASLSSRDLNAIQSESFGIGSITVLSDRLKWLGAPDLDPTVWLRRA